MTDKKTVLVLSFLVHHSVHKHKHQQLTRGLQVKHLQKGPANILLCITQYQYWSFKNDLFLYKPILIVSMVYHLRQQHSSTLAKKIDYVLDEGRSFPV